MSVLVDKNTKLIFQGITGRSGSFHANLCLEYGTNIVAGVSPKKGGELFQDKVPIYTNVATAKEKEDANATVIFVPAPFAKDSILEAIEAEIPLIVVITEGIPLSDMVIVRQALNASKSRMIGPNCPGIITPGECKIGIMPGYIHNKGNVGIISRSGTLTYEAVWQLTSKGYGQTTCIGIGGDPIHGLSLLDCVKLFEEDDETRGIIIIGEIGGQEEEDVAHWAKQNKTKPMVGYVAGATAPHGRRMGHAGAIISGGKGTAKEKIETLESCGIVVAKTPNVIGARMIELL